MVHVYNLRKKAVLYHSVCRLLIYSQRCAAARLVAGRFVMQWVVQVEEGPMLIRCIQY